ncbi:hypothetical protein [Sphingomonas sp.]|uniref:hypothetical protein n=1 Tax=Sphingomonas sp. TaxID=28214 RepID=UPI0025E51803|nr:hypothetical protein [Sphingomonas sp.]
MLTADLRQVIGEMRETVQTANAALLQRPDRWRNEIVVMRLQLAKLLGCLGKFVAAAPASPELVNFRRALSHLRGTVAELQANWPAVSLDPDAPEFKRAAQRVGLSLEAIQKAVVELERFPDGFDRSGSSETR